jgi:8-oxo-dGTP pyrophosphatase MutT (NUDIX family)
MKKNWTFLNSKISFKNNVLSIEEKTYFFNKSCSSMPFTVINTKDWVLVIPKMRNGNFLIVEQFRIAADSVTLEFPGGAIDKNEDKLTGALRELREETGLKPAQIEFLGTIKPNPAILSNSCHIFYAEDCIFEFNTDFDEFEDINLIEVNEKNFEMMIKKGKIIHSLVLAAYSLYKLKKTGGKND